MKKIFVMILLVCVVALWGCNEQTTQIPARDTDGSQAQNPSDNAGAPSGGETSAAGLPAHDAPPIDNTDADVIEIKEKLFIAQTNDIYINPEDYLGKTIKYEGIFDIFTWEDTGEIFYSVIRYGPGCCGFDANAGFEVVWDGEYPNQNDWVEAVGVLELYEEGEYKYLRLQLSSLTVLSVRGAEYVSQ